MFEAHMCLCQRLYPSIRLSRLCMGLGRGFDRTFDRSCLQPRAMHSWVASWNAASRPLRMRLQSCLGSLSAVNVIMLNAYSLRVWSVGVAKKLKGGCNIRGSARMRMEHARTLYSTYMIHYSASNRCIAKA
jgi:hypothetical protein